MCIKGFCITSWTLTSKVLVAYIIILIGLVLFTARLFLKYIIISDLLLILQITEIRIGTGNYMNNIYTYIATYICV